MFEDWKPSFVTCALSEPAAHHLYFARLHRVPHDHKIQSQAFIQDVLRNQCHELCWKPETKHTERLLV